MARHKRERQQNESRTYKSVRDELLRILTEAAPNHLKTNEISKRLGIRATSPEYDMVRRALEELQDEGLIFRAPKRKYGRKVPVVVVEGRLEMVNSDRWLVIPDDPEADAVVVDRNSLWTGFHGDYVRAKVTSMPGPGERPQGEVTKILERPERTVAGTLHQGRNVYLQPDDRRMHRTITIYKKRLGDTRIGDKVLVKLREWTDPTEDPEGIVLRRLGRAGEMKAEIAAIAATYNLPHVFPDDVLAEADEFPDGLSDEELERRVDLRDLDIVTIDPVDARDFDDAISLEEHDNGEVTLGVHIADVSHYVREGSPLDREALIRGTSVYLVTGVIPMLPERLSNNLCSLRPNEDRPAYSVLIRLSPRGAVRNYRIVESVIRSKRRFSYEEALEALQTGEGFFAEQLQKINRIVHALRANRNRKGSVDFDRAELKFVLDDNDRPVEVLQKRATESTRLIEDCMLLANRVVAEHVARRRFEEGRGKGGRNSLNPFVYRVHDVPPKDKLLELSNFVKSLGYSLPTDNIQPKDIQKLVEWARGTDREELINEVTLRSMAKAVYSAKNIGHFGLAFKYYTHFTSPIRRYPDLIVHRMLKEYAEGMDVRRRNYYQDSLPSTARHCSERERAAVEAERESVKIAQVEFLKQHVGDVFEAVIVGVTSFGIFAELRRFGISGMVPVRTMRGDRYHYDERQKRLRGLTTGKTFRIGDGIFVRVIRVDEVKTEIDLEVIDREEFVANSDGQIIEGGSAEPEAGRPGESTGSGPRSAQSTGRRGNGSSGKGKRGSGKKSSGKSGGRSSESKSSGGKSSGSRSSKGKSTRKKPSASSKRGGGRKKKKK